MTAYTLRPPDLHNLADQPATRDHISHTALGTFLTCEQKYGFSYDQRLEPAVTATPLELGRCFAHALEHGDPTAGETMLLQDALDLAERAKNSPWLVAPDLDAVRVNATIVREAARAYLNAYGATVRREIEIRVRIRNPEDGGRYSLTHDLLGRVDGLSEDGLELIEDKLQGQIPSPAILSQRLRLDRQITIGCYLHWRTTGQEIQQIRYRITRKPSIKRRQNESPDEYLVRLTEDYAARPDFYLLEEIVARREPDDYLRLEQELWEWAEQIRRARKSGIWPRNTGACLDFGGCAFLSLCSREPGAIHQFREREQRPVGAPAATEVPLREITKEATAA